MKVYVVLEDGVPVEVFSSEEKAWEEIIKRASADAPCKEFYEDDISSNVFNGTFEDWVRAGYVSDYWHIYDFELKG